MEVDQELDQEWVELIKEARDLGISLKELHSFFQGESEEIKQCIVNTIR